jgi:hypothetical protein
MRPNVIDKIMNNSREIELKNGKILCCILGGCECANNVVNKGQKSLALSSRYTLKAVVVFFLHMPFWWRFSPVKGRRGFDWL